MPYQRAGTLTCRPWFADTSTESLTLHPVEGFPMTSTEQFETILCEEDGPIFTITLNRPDHGNMFNTTMLREMYAALELSRRETRTRVVVITGAGDRYFCIGGEKTDLEDSFGYPGFLPVVDVYAQIERHPQPGSAAVHGYAVGGVG